MFAALKQVKSRISYTGWLVILASLVLVTVMGSMLLYDKVHAQPVNLGYENYAGISVKGSADRTVISRNWLISKALGVEDVLTYFTLFKNTTPLFIDNKGVVLANYYSVNIPQKAGCPGVASIAVVVTNEDPAVKSSTVMLQSENTLLAPTSDYGTASTVSNMPFNWEVVVAKIPAELRSTINQVSILSNYPNTELELWGVTVEYDCMPEDLQGFKSISPDADPASNTAFMPGLFQAVGVQEGGVGLWRTFYGIPFEITCVYGFNNDGLKISRGQDVYVLATWTTGAIQPVLLDYPSQFQYLGNYNGTELGILAFTTPADKTQTYVIVGLNQVLGVTTRPTGYVPETPAQ